MRRNLITAVLVVAGLAAVAAVILYNADTSRLDRLTEEDGVVEYGQAAGYLLAAALFLVGWVQGRFRHWCVAGLGAVFFLVGGEEISWGQRLFGVETPESLREVNVQGETTLHNIEGVHQTVRLVGLVVILGLTVVVPLTNRWVPRLRELYERLALPIVPLWTLPVTVIGIGFMAVPRLIGDVVFTLDEVGELFISATFLLFAIDWFTGDRHALRRAGDAARVAAPTPSA